MTWDPSFTFLLKEGFLSLLKIHQAQPVWTCKLWVQQWATTRPPGKLEKYGTWQITKNNAFYWFIQHIFLQYKGVTAADTNVRTCFQVLIVVSGDHWDWDVWVVTLCSLGTGCQHSKKDVIPTRVEAVGVQMWPGYTHFIVSSLSHGHVCKNAVSHNSVISFLLAQTGIVCSSSPSSM
jgi:hypothetical protein